MGCAGYGGLSNFAGPWRLVSVVSMAVLVVVIVVTLVTRVDGQPGNDRLDVQQGDDRRELDINLDALSQISFFCDIIK
ncbi:hypothetical protein ACOMHN_035443 [Nucella lapillus]